MAAAVLAKGGKHPGAKALLSVRRLSVQHRLFSPFRTLRITSAGACQPAADQRQLIAKGQLAPADPHSKTFNESEADVGPSAQGGKSSRFDGREQTILAASPPAKLIPRLATIVIAGLTRLLQVSR
jgi:hypothetical protein